MNKRAMSELVKATLFIDRLDWEGDFDFWRKVHCALVFHMNAEQYKEYFEASMCGSSTFGEAATAGGEW